MRAIALPIVILMLTATFAGCVGGDPDGDDSSGIDMEILNQMIDDNLQDFINNTTVTVNQDFHYYNNTTIQNDDNSVSNINGSGVSSSSEMNVFTVEWDPFEFLEPLEYGNRIISVVNGNLQQSTGNSNLLFVTVYNGYIIEFENITCEVARNYGDLRDDDWMIFLWENYGENWNDIYEASREIEDFWNVFSYYYSGVVNSWVNESGYSIGEQCGFTSTPFTTHTLFSLDLNQGEAIEFLTLPNGIEINAICADGYSVSTTNNSLTGPYIGGHDDCTVYGTSRIYGSHTYNYTSYDNSSPNSSEHFAGLPPDIASWWPQSFWYIYQENTEQISSSVAGSFSVYFRMWDVVPYSEDA